jgi:hypothetical protein
MDSRRYHPLLGFIIKSIHYLFQTVFVALKSWQIELHLAGGSFASTSSAVPFSVFRDKVINHSLQ